jgi:hypothetical protein
LLSHCSAKPVKQSLTLQQPGFSFGDDRSTYYTVPLLALNFYRHFIPIVFARAGVEFPHNETFLVGTTTNFLHINHGNVAQYKLPAHPVSRCATQLQMKFAKT